MVLLSGNEAVARGAYEHGVRVATAYPGTPSTEILENIAQYEEIDAQWSTNEKVAFEVALGAAFGGARSLVAMKHVGVNVAADPLFSAAHTGVGGGFVLISADDPGMHSSQNEQDNRLYAKFAKLPLIEPSDSQECLDFLGVALEISEEYGIPVLFRMSTRVCHSKTPVELGSRRESTVREYEKDIKRRLLIPAHARKRHIRLEEKMRELQQVAEDSALNRVEDGKDKTGVVTSGIAYQYAKEALPDASFLKLGFSYPFPESVVQSFAKRCDRIYVVEENEPFLEEHMIALGIPVIGKEKIPRCGELSQRIVAAALEGDAVECSPAETAPRPPVLCPGCPHRGFFYHVNRMRLTATGDIGCYTLGALEPLNAMDTCVCMGASIGNAIGFEKAQGRAFASKTVAVIGDSTFLHSGITGLLDLVYNQGTVTVVVLDNSVTAMTGHQEHPGTGKTLRGTPAPAVNYAELARALGVNHVKEVDAYDLDAISAALDEATGTEEPSVLIVKGECILRVRERWGPSQVVDTDTCTACGMCLKIGCPAISRDAEGKSRVEPSLCVGETCSVCAQVCPKGCFSTGKGGDEG
jgi:indolepyruvate ferredoxin oxidoreductase alpha subunit